ncbi:hypothetical protein VPNG_00229 [Cytospora leucostoma]|uniref:Mid2 domain-containing protein n=1 Tax=Cytospora leucostoma TaxID=1230097 RepID=A0A423XNL8_9PEZI|nr:hypothetical protein VPNG_00229 [Cytospora leucostoma]
MEWKTTRGSGVPTRHGKTRHAPSSTAGIRPCDGITEGNHYCCDTGEDGVGSYACCDNSTDIFVLGSSIPSVLAQMPLSQTSTSTTASATGTSSSTSTATHRSEHKSGSSGLDETAVGVGVGLGVGVPLAVAVGGIIWFLTWRSRRKERLQRGAAIESAYGEGAGQPGGGGSGGGGGDAAAQQQQHLYHHPDPTSADYIPKYGMALHEMQSPTLPAELPTTPMAELP